MSKFVGQDFEQLRIALEDIPNAIDGIAKETVENIKGLILEEFDKSADPFGNPWIPNKAGTQTLVRTGAMRSSLIVMADGKEIFISMDEPANYHQTGTYKMPARPILPEDELPKEWEAVLEENTGKIFEDKLDKSKK